MYCSYSLKTNTSIYFASSHYRAFGMVMPERAYNAEKYRWGFNGKENDNETRWQDYGFRMYYPGLGKFFSVDPLTATYPMLTPYQFASNTPIMAIDIDGLEAIKSTTINSDGSTVIYIRIDINVIDGTNPKIFTHTNRKNLTTTYSVDYQKGTLTPAEIDQFVTEYQKEIPQYLNGYDKKTNTFYEFEVGKINKIPSEEFNENGGGLNVVIIKDIGIQFDGTGLLSSLTQGESKEIGNSQNNSMQVRIDAPETTKAHETGHWLGLEHVKPYSDGTNQDRLMKDGKFITPANAPMPTKVTNEERKTMSENVPKRSQGGGGGILINQPKQTD